jgi:hypothetical protein
MTRGNTRFSDAVFCSYIMLRRDCRMTPAFLSRSIRWAGHVECVEAKNTYRILVLKLEGQGTPGRKMGDNIRKAFIEIGTNGGEEERVYVIGRKETTRKTET